jgi:hypothetical protein
LKHGFIVFSDAPWLPCSQSASSRGVLSVCYQYYCNRRFEKNHWRRNAILIATGRELTFSERGRADLKHPPPPREMLISKAYLVHHLDSSLSLFTKPFPLTFDIRVTKERSDRMIEQFAILFCVRRAAIDFSRRHEKHFKRSTGHKSLAKDLISNIDWTRIFGENGRRIYPGKIES